MFVSIFTETFAIISQAAAQDPEALQAQIMQSVMEQTRSLLPISFAINALFIALVASAIARRLHDRDWSGWWVLILPVTAIIGTIASWWLFAAIGDNPQMMIDQPQLFQLAGWLPLIGYIVLIVQLVQSGDPRANRFGDPPA